MARSRLSLPAGAPPPGGNPSIDTPVAPTFTLWRLMEFARPRAAWIALGLFLTIAAGLVALIPPYLTRPLLDDVLIPRQAGREVPLRWVGWYLGWMALAAVVSWALGWARNDVMARVSERISADLRSRTHAHLMGLSLEFFGGIRTGDLMARVGNDTERLNNFLSVNLVDFAADVVMIVGTAVVLIVAAPELAAATLGPLPLVVAMVQRVRERLRRGFGETAVAWASLNSVLSDTLGGIRLVKAFAQEDREVERFDRANWHVVQTADRVNTVWAVFGPLVGLLTQGGLILVWGVGAWLVFERGFQVGLLTMFLTYLARFYTRLESLSRMVQSTQKAAASAQRLFEILDARPSVAEPIRPIVPGRIRGAIELRRVTFRHGPRTILDNVSLVIEPGEMIGLVGPSGSGKSTLVNLVCRFYDVDAGQVLVDGIDVRHYALRDYRRQIGVVLQEPHLFYGTVAENIAYGRPEASRAEIQAAARAARAHEFIVGLAGGYDAMVGERGQSLSGGERQRIAIARALLIDPAILILDEATSSVDVTTEREIQEALENLIRGRTTIAIAHRLATLRRADRIVLLDRGRIVESGPPSELLAAQGAYAQLHRVHAD